MNDLDLLDRFGPMPKDLSATAMDAARARLDAAVAQAAPVERRPRRRLPLLAAAAAAAVGLAITPALIGSHESIALAAVDPLTFPLTPTALPEGLGDPVFERDSNFMAARYGAALDGVSIVTEVEDDGRWSIPDNAPTAEIDGHRATVITRTVFNGTPSSAPAVTVIWHSDNSDWTAVRVRAATPTPLAWKRSPSLCETGRSRSTSHSASPPGDGPSSRTRRTGS